MPSIKRCTSVAGGVATFSDVVLTGTAGQGVPTGGTAGQVLSKIDVVNYNTQWVTIPALTDTNKGDINVTGTGTAWTINPSVVTYAKIQNVSATDRLLGRFSVGAGSIEEIACTSFGRAVIGAANVAAQQSALALVPGTNVQAFDADLATISGLTPTTNNVMQSVAGAWASRTPTQVTATLDLATTAAKGLIPVLPGTTTMFLNGNGVFTTPTPTPVAGSVTLAMMANLAQDQVIGRVTASTGVPETFTVTGAARGVLSQTTLPLMLSTLGGVAKIGDSITGMLSLTTANAGLRLMRMFTNNPFIEFYDTTGVTSYGFVQFSATSWTISKGASIGLTGTTTDVTANLPLLLTADPAVPLGAATKQYADTKAPLRQTVQVQASGVTSWTIALADENKLTVFTAVTAITVTVPLNFTLAVPVGYRTDFAQTGSGKTTVSGAVGVTITATPSAVLRAAGSMASLIKTAAPDTWILTGDLT